MRRLLLLFALAGAMLVGCAGAVLAQQQASPAAAARQAAKHLAPPGRYEPVCPKPDKKPGEATCLSKVRTDANQSGASPTLANPSGYYPSDLQAAYNLPSKSAAGSGTTVAVVTAYDDPNAEDDLNAYRGYFGLPACTSANGCFTKADQGGGASYPNPDEGWSLEASLDLDMVSAVCPECNVLLVEADDATLENLGAGVDTAIGLGANVVNNSYGADEFAGETGLEPHYDHPGVAITASSGDYGYDGGVLYPAASRHVTAVGGTSLSKDDGSSGTRGWSETVWNSTTSGCSAYVSKPSWQTDGGCAKRTVGDVAADADPNTGVAVYDSYGFGGKSGWFQEGGTSVSAPLVAGVYALAGNTSSINDGSYPYGHVSALFDVTSGSNGSCGAAATSAAATDKKHPASPDNEQAKQRAAGPEDNERAEQRAAGPDDNAHKKRERREERRERRRRRRQHESNKKKHHGSSSPTPGPQPPSSSPSPPGSSSSQYLCTGEPGYDGPTGNGTPNGTGAF